MKLEDCEITHAQGLVSLLHIPTGRSITCGDDSKTDEQLLSILEKSCVQKEDPKND